MKINKGLATIVLSTGILFGGCSKTVYNLPNEEKVCIEEEVKGWGSVGSMTITKTDDRIIKINYIGHVNLGETPTIRSVEITKDKSREEYTQQEVLEEAKKEVAEYYKKITEKGVKDLK